MEDNHATLLPLLQRLGVPATVYVITGLVGRPNPWLIDTGARMMTEAELLELHAAGIELGAHTVTHPDMSELDYDACLDEMKASRAALEELTGAPVTTFAYPYCRYGPEAERAAQDAGFAGAVSCVGKGTNSLFAIERAMISGKDGTGSVVLKAAGVYHALFDSPPVRLARTATRDMRTRRRAARAAG
jgi:peptidoglycan/xylan/chitin deacetylase (PgdA/CDA1 family)